MKNKTNNLIYRVWIKSKNLYYKGYKGKSVWLSLEWALVSAKQASTKYGIQSIEIHEFQCVNAIKHSYEQIINQKNEDYMNKERMKNKKLIENKLKIAVENLNKAIYEADLYNIKIINELHEF
ncbi:hypothetical protein M0Q50_06015 [bacterium]|jgi:hypothetical protein|nr:hypothetical protein [bacterium]